MDANLLYIRRKIKIFTDNYSANIGFNPRILLLKRLPQKVDNVTVSNNLSARPYSYEFRCYHLSISRQIMRQHNGTIDLVRSDVNQTVFELKFR